MVLPDTGELDRSVRDLWLCATPHRGTRAASIGATGVPAVYCPARLSQAKTRVCTAQFDAIVRTLTRNRLPLESLPFPSPTLPPLTGV